MKISYLFAVILLAMTNLAHSLDYSLFANLNHEKPSVSYSFADYLENVSLISALNTPVVDDAPGLLQDRPLGFRAESSGYSVYLLVYQNTYLKNFNGIVVNKIWRSNNVLIETGYKSNYIESQSIQSIHTSITLPTLDALALNLRAKVSLINMPNQSVIGLFDFKIYL